jgi:hypothetical protein
VEKAEEEMVWALTPVDTARGAPPLLSPSRYLSPSYLVGLLWVSVGECLFLCFAGTQKRYIFAAGTYKVGRKGASLDLPLRFFMFATYWIGNGEEQRSCFFMVLLKFILSCLKFT